MADGFLGRWSQRKQAVREGKTLDEPASFQSDAVVPADEPNERHAESPEKLPLPTLQDVTNLSSESDFKPFFARDVAPEVLQGHPATTIAVIDAIQRKHRYVSGVFAFRNDEIPSRAAASAPEHSIQTAASRPAGVSSPTIRTS